MKIEAQDTTNRVFPLEWTRIQAEDTKRESEKVKPVEKSAQPELAAEGNELRFGNDAQTGRPVIRVVDRETKDIIDQIPRESWNPWPPRK
jgi:uncharacterized FlaG/YvyC family protein